MDIIEIREYIDENSKQTRVEKVSLGQKMEELKKSPLQGIFKEGAEVVGLDTPERQEGDPDAKPCQTWEEFVQRVDELSILEEVGGWRGSYYDMSYREESICIYISLYIYIGIVVGVLFPCLSRIILARTACAVCFFRVLITVRGVGTGGRESEGDE